MIIRHNLALSIGMAGLMGSVAFGGSTYEGGITFPTDVPVVSEWAQSPEDPGHALISSDGTNPAELVVSNASGTIDAPLTDLVFDSADGCVSGALADGVTASTYLPAYFDPSTHTTNKYVGGEIVYWTGRTLANIKSVRGVLWYQSGGRQHFARTCFFKNDGQTATAQFQTRMNGDEKYLICIKVTFRQQGSDITAKAEYSGYVNSATTQICEAHDFDRDGCSVQSIRDGVYSFGGYGLRTLQAGEVDDSGKGGKGMKIVGSINCVSPTGGATTDLPRWKNLKLADIEGFWGYTTDKGFAKAYFLKTSEDGKTMSAWFECMSDTGDSGSGPYIVCNKVVFTQDGDDVVISWVKCGYVYVKDNAKCIPYDADTYGINEQAQFPYVLTTIRPILKRGKASMTLNGPLNVVGDINVTAATAQFGVPSLIAGPVPAFIGDGTVRFYRDVSEHVAQSQGIRLGTSRGEEHAGVVVFDGCEAYLTNQYSVTKSWPIALQNGADVHLSIPNDKELGDSGRSILIESGSTLHMDRQLNLAFPLIYLDSGTLELNAWMRYISYIALKDGSSVGGAGSFRFDGYMRQYPTIYSYGSSSATNVINCEMQLYSRGPNAVEARAKSYIRMVTESDLLISGKLANASDSGYGAVKIRKLGSAKLILSGGCTHTSNWEVVNGTLTLASANSMTVNNGITLKGGNLETTAATVCKFLNTDTALATVKIGDGGSLTLASADDLSVGSGTLVIDAESGTGGVLPVRVGTSACISSAQLKLIRHKRAGGLIVHTTQRDDGYLLTAEGTLMIVR